MLIVAFDNKIEKKKYRGKKAHTLLLEVDYFLLMKASRNHGLSYVRYFVKKL